MVSGKPQFYCKTETLYKFLMNVVDQTCKLKPEFNDLDHRKQLEFVGIIKIDIAIMH